ncbi:MAG: hypothetical protein GWP21_03060 [Euryarchaeota archaeon]|nr:hypothetical protein [Euryarchaeota archaeon]
MVTTPCPHCNQKIEFDATMPGTYECPFCGKQFKLGKRTKPNPISNTTKPKEVVQQSKRSVGQNIALGLSLSIGTIFAMISIFILFEGILGGAQFILLFLPLTFFIGSYFLLYYYKITSKSSDNQTATLLIGGKETTIQLQSNNNQALDGVLKGLKVGMIVTLVLTVIGLVMAVMAILALFGLLLSASGGGGW